MPRKVGGENKTNIGGVACCWSGRTWL